MYPKPCDMIAKKLKLFIYVIVIPALLLVTIAYMCKLGAANTGSEIHEKKSEHTIGE